MVSNVKCVQYFHYISVSLQITPLNLKYFLLRYELFTDASAGFIAYPDDFLFCSDRLRSEALIVDGPIIATTMEASDVAEPVVIKIKERPIADSNDIIQGVKSISRIVIIVILATKYINMCCGFQWCKT